MSNVELKYISKVTSLIEKSKLTYEDGMELIVNYNSLSEKEKLKFDKISINDITNNRDLIKVSKEDLKGNSKSSMILNHLKEVVTPWFLICFSYSFVLLVIGGDGNFNKGFELYHIVLFIIGRIFGIMIWSSILTLIIGFFTGLKHFKKTLLWTTTILGVFLVLRLIV